MIINLTSLAKNMFSNNKNDPDHNNNSINTDNNKTNKINYEILMNIVMLQYLLMRII